MAQRDIVLDSTIIIQHARVRNKRESLFSRSLLIYYPNLSVISVYEIELGAYRAGRVSDIDTLQVNFSILPVTEEIARRAARLDADLIRQNLQIFVRVHFRELNIFAFFAKISL